MRSRLSEVRVAAGLSNRYVTNSLFSRIVAHRVAVLGRMLSLFPFHQHAGEVHPSPRNGTQPVEDDPEELWDAAVLSKVP
jgi:hypothetical protein